MLDRFYKDRRRAQSGATLVEVLVAITVMGLSLALIVGTLSTGLLDSALSKRNTAAQAVIQYEMEEITASSYGSQPGSYSECFATEGPSGPVTITYQAACPDSSFSLRADVTASPGPTSTSQIWTIAVVWVPSGAQVGSSVQLVKINR